MKIRPAVDPSGGRMPASICHDNIALRCRQPATICRVKVDEHIERNCGLFHSKLFIMNAPHGTRAHARGDIKKQCMRLRSDLLRRLQRSYCSSLRARYPTRSSAQPNRRRPLSAPRHQSLIRPQKQRRRPHQLPLRQNFLEKSRYPWRRRARWNALIA